MKHRGKKKGEHIGTRRKEDKMTLKKKIKVIVDRKELKKIR